MSEPRWDLQHVDSWPSPYCGRLDDHEAHGKCPGPPTITKAEKQAVEKSVRRARGEQE